MVVPRRRGVGISVSVAEDEENETGLFEETLKTSLRAYREGDDIPGEKKKLKLKSKDYDDICSELLGKKFQTVVKKLTSYKFENDSVILSKGNEDFIFSIISLILKPNQAPDLKYEMIKLKLEKTRNKSDIFNGEEFDPMKEELLRLKSLSEWKPKTSKYVGRCGKCGSNQVYTTLKTERSLDEGQVTHYFCDNCNSRWKQ